MMQRSVRPKGHSMRTATNKSRSNPVKPPQGRAVIQGPSSSRSRPRTLIISDIRLLREGLVMAIRQNGRLELVAAVSTEEALDISVAQIPDVALLDAHAAGGAAMPRLLRDVLPGVSVVVFAIGDGEPDILGWVEAGASGFVGRDGSIDEVVGAVEGALRGEIFCSPKLTSILLARVARLAGAPPSTDIAAKLTPREREVMALVELGLPNKKIAQRLGICHTTVKNHVHHVLEKIKAGGRGEAAAWMRNGGEPRETWN